MNSFLRFFWLACISGLVGCRSDHSYTHESATLFDAARLIGADQSDEPHLLRLFERFADTECGGRRLARLTVSADDNDLEAALNVYFPEADPTKAIRAGFVSLDVGRPGLAQAWCLDDQATVIIKRKDGVLRHQIRGDHDARSLTLNGYAMTLVGVRLSPTIQPSMVSLFAVGSDLPEVGVAESIHAAVERKVGSGTFLYLRTDPMFAQYDGPSWDIFATQRPRSM